jgi:purine-binding chemotaxis protein CheW
MIARGRDIDAILRRRAEQLALHADDEGARATEELVTFSVGPHQIGVPTVWVGHAATIHHLTEVPGGPAWLVDITTVEGQLVSLVELCALLGLAQRGVRDAVSSLVVASGGRQIGLTAEQIFGIEDVPSAAIAALPSADGPLTRIANLPACQLLVLDDVPALLADPRSGARR